MKQGYFVTGTDTGIGKTTVSCVLLRAFVARGMRAVGMKPVASGCLKTLSGPVSEDALQLQAAGSVEAGVNMINPYAFEPALAPHIAAGMTGTEIELATIANAFNTLQAMADVVIVEGVGGFRVPLNEIQDTADMAVMLRLPVVLVVGMRLGCLNHALLTLDAIRQRDLKLAGWVANRVDPDMDAFEENLAALRQRIPAPCLAVINFQNDVNGFQKNAVADIELPNAGS